MTADAAITVAVAHADGRELPALAAIERAAFDVPGFDLAEELARPWARLWVARVAGSDAPAGFLLAWEVADELHVLTVATLPELRRRGVGRALVRAALDSARARRARLVLLEVRRGNVAAIALYRAAGFHALGVRARYYTDGEDALEMTLVLDPATGEIVPGRDEVRLEEM